MNHYLVSYLFPIDASLLKYLDEDRGLSHWAAQHLYRYAVAMLQGLVSPDQVKEDWEDFFYLAGGFVFAYGSGRLSMSARMSSVLWVNRVPGPINEWDRMLLIDFVREVGEFASSRGGATMR